MNQESKMLRKILLQPIVVMHALDQMTLLEEFNARLVLEADAIGNCVRPFINLYRGEKVGMQHVIYYFAQCPCLVHACYHAHPCAFYVCIKWCSLFCYNSASLPFTQEVECTVFLQQFYGCLVHPDPARWHHPSSLSVALGLTGCFGISHHSSFGKLAEKS